MNLEMYIENIKNNKAKSYGQRSRKRKNKYKLKFTLFIFFIFIFSFIYFLKVQKLNFEFEKHFLNISNNEMSINTLEPYAKNIAICKNDKLEDEYEAQALLLISKNKKEAIYSKNAFKRMHPASTTKLMTALIALKYTNLDEEVKVGNEVLINEIGSSMANIKPGSSLSMKQLLYALMLPSGNDAANAIAIHISGSIEEFAKLMNEEAKKIYATNSNFKNANGLTNDMHYSTSYDLYLIMNECLKYDIFRKITTTPAYEPTYFLADGSKFINHWDNSNQYLLGKVGLRGDLEIIGAKTGTTKVAGACLVLGTKNKENQEEYISVVLNATNKNILYENMNKLLEKVNE